MNAKQRKRAHRNTCGATGSAGDLADVEPRARQLQRAVECGQCDPDAADQEIISMAFAALNHYRITPEDWLLMEKIAKEARCVLQWWADFVSNLERQGWISNKQRMKLKAFNYEHEMNRAYGCGGRRKSKHWAAGLDHETTSEYTGEPCAAEFSS